MWISGGDHQLSDNIVHMVLAKIAGGPAGVKGISLFIVPRQRIMADGTVRATQGTRRHIASRQAESWPSVITAFRKS